MGRGCTQVEVRLGSHTLYINYVVHSDVHLFLQSVAPYIGVPRHASPPSTFSAAFIFVVLDYLRLFAYFNVLPIMLPRITIWLMDNICF